MNKVYITDTEIISPLGFSTQENFENLLTGNSGINYTESPDLLEKAFYAAAIPEKKLEKAFCDLTPASEEFTKLEKMLFLSINKILEKNQDLNLNKSILILSTTKGNIDTLQKNSLFSKSRAKLHELGKQIQDFFELPNAPIILSNACISGGLAISVGKKLLETQKYENAIIVGGDILSKFTLSGFSSFQALDNKNCAPFSENRNGINLGEAAACMLLETNSKKNEAIHILGEATANDANHISGPSRTGEGLLISIQKALKEADISSEKIDYISAHGTATAYNDDMEAMAFSRANLSQVPINSFKGYYGHTLGASALLESILSVESMRRNQLIPNFGFTESGTSKPLNIITSLKKASLNTVLKTASGFGGCNFAMLLKKQ